MKRRAKLQQAKIVRRQGVCEGHHRIERQPFRVLKGLKRANIGFQRAFQQESRMPLRIG